MKLTLKPSLLDNGQFRTILSYSLALMFIAFLIFKSDKQYLKADLFFLESKQSHFRPSSQSSIGDTVFNVKLVHSTKFTLTSNKADRKIKIPDKSPMKDAKEVFDNIKVRKVESSQLTNAASKVLAKIDGAKTDRDNNFNPIVYLAPTYPQEAIQNAITGLVKIELFVNSEGVVIESNIIQSSGSHLLDSSALKAVSFWLFEPLTINDNVRKDIFEFYFEIE